MRNTISLIQNPLSITSGHHDNIYSVENKKSGQLTCPLTTIDFVLSSELHSAKTIPQKQAR